MILLVVDVAFYLGVTVMAGIENSLVVGDITTIAKLAEKDPNMSAIITVCSHRMVREAGDIDRSFAAGGLDDRDYQGAALRLEKAVAERGLFQHKSKIYPYVESQFYDPTQHRSFEGVRRQADLTFAVAEVLLFRAMQQNKRVAIHCITGSDRASTVTFGIIYRWLKKLGVPAPTKQTLALLFKLNPFGQPRDVTSILELGDEAQTEKALKKIGRYCDDVSRINGHRRLMQQEMRALQGRLSVPAVSHMAPM